MKIAACSLKRTQVTGFLMELKKHKKPLKEFDPLVWQATVNHARVERDCTITFVFRDGTEVKANIKNGVTRALLAGAAIAVEVAFALICFLRFYNYAAWISGFIRVRPSPP